MPIEEATLSFVLWRVAMEEEESAIRIRCGRGNLEFFAAKLLGTGHRIVVYQSGELQGGFGLWFRGQCRLQANHLKDVPAWTCGKRFYFHVGFSLVSQSSRGGAG